MNIDKQSTWPSCDHKHTNNRHRYTISVSEKIFKIKKNQSYIRNNKKHETTKKSTFDRTNEQIVAQAQELV